MAQTDGKLGLNYAAGSVVTSWNDVAENMRKIDNFATQVDGKITDDVAALESFKGSVIDGADEIWATTQDGIPAGAHGVSQLITSVRTTITQKVAELTEKITANTNKTEVNEAAIEALNSKLYTLNYNNKKDILTATGATFTAPYNGVIRYMNRASAAGAFFEYLIGGSGTAISNHIYGADSYLSGEFTVCEGDTITCRYISIKSSKTTFIPWV